MFERRIQNQLHEWAEKNNRKPLILRGARQVGKTTIVEQFGKEFDNFLSLNLEKKEAKDLFESTDDVKMLLPLLFLYDNKPQRPGRTLLFIDEIQSSPQAVALLLELVYPTTHTIMPATTDLKRAPKLIWLDTGLVNYAAEIQKEYLLSKDLTDTWRGMAAEQIVAQELKALSNEVGKKQKFWVRAKRGSSAEVDFVYIYGGKIIPIEVKNGHNAHLKSIHQFMNETEHDLAVRIWSGNYAIDEVTTNEGKHFKLINLPFYMIAALPNILKKIET